MRLTLRQLQIFIAVADTGSTTAAGLRVALSQSATSGALNELEALLGARLFDRVGKRLVLNDTGRALLPQARALLDGALGIEAQFLVGSSPGQGRGAGRAAGGLAGIPVQLRVGASTTIGNYLLPALVASHLRAAGNGAVAIDVTIGNTADIAAAVARLDVDLGLIEGPCHDPELQAEPWLDDQLVIVCAPSHALSNELSGAQSDGRPGARPDALGRDAPQARIGLKTLRQQRWLLREPGSGTREAVEHALLPHLHQWVQPMQLGSTEAIKQAAAEGLGLTCLSLCAVQDLLTLGRLAVLPTTLPRLSRRFYLIHHRRKQLSASLQRFVAHCQAGL